MKIRVMSFDEAEKYEEDAPHYVISIVSPNSSEAKLPINGKRIGVLYLRFYDMDKHLPGQADEGLFSEKMADEILEFIGLSRREITVIVHCEAGISRSPAVAAALAYIHNGAGEDSVYFKKYIPNRRVYSTILRRYFDRISPAPGGEESK